MLLVSCNWLSIVYLVLSGHELKSIPVWLLNHWLSFLCLQHKAEFAFPQGIFIHTWAVALLHCFLKYCFWSYKCLSVCSTKVYFHMSLFICFLLAGWYLLQILFWQDCFYVYLLLTIFSKFLAWKPFLLLLFNWSNSGNMGWLSTTSRSILYLFFNVDHPCQCKVSVRLNLCNFPCWHLQFIFCFILVSLS